MKHQKKKPVIVKPVGKKKTYDVSYLVGGIVVVLAGVGSYLFYKRK